MQNTSELYIGIDVHKKSWSVNLRTDLFDHKTFSMDSDPAQLRRYVDRHEQYKFTPTFATIYLGANVRGSGFKRSSEGHLSFVEEMSLWSAKRYYNLSQNNHE